MVSSFSRPLQWRWVSVVDFDTGGGIGVTMTTPNHSISVLGDTHRRVDCLGAECWLVRASRGSELQRPEFDGGNLRVPKMSPQKAREKGIIGSFNKRTITDCLPGQTRNLATCQL
jgi:hypothetical protein